MEIKDKNGLTEKEFLEQYQPGDYVRPSVAADMVIFTAVNCEKDNYRRLPEKKLRLLLIRRGGHPYINTWALPGGFVNPDETTEQAARRELLEETGVDHIYLEQLYTFSQPDRDPRMWVMSCSYMALIDSTKVNVNAGDDATDAKWFDISLKTIAETISENEYGASAVTDYHLTLSHGEINLSASLRKTLIRNGTGIQTEYEIRRPKRNASPPPTKPRSASSVSRSWPRSRIKPPAR